jgi:hypothetical protein
MRIHADPYQDPQHWFQHRLNKDIGAKAFVNVLEKNPRIIFCGNVLLRLRPFDSEKSVPQKQMIRSRSGPESSRTMIRIRPLRKKQAKQSLMCTGTS